MQPWFFSRFLSSPGVKIELNVKSKFKSLFFNIKRGATSLGPRGASWPGHGHEHKLTEVRGGGVQGWAPVAAGTCVARVLGAEMTGDAAMFARGCEEDIEVIPETQREKRGPVLG